MDVVGADRVDLSIGEPLPEPLAVGTLAKRRIDLADVAALPGHVMGEVVRARLEIDARTGASLLRPASSASREVVCTT